MDSTHITDDQIDPMETRLADVVAGIHGWTRQCASTTAICAKLNWSVPESTVRFWLRRAEVHGKVYRLSERGGWYATSTAGVPANAFRGREKPPRWWDRRWWMRTRQLALPLLCEIRRAAESPKRKTEGRGDRMMKNIEWRQLPLPLTWVA